MSEEITNNAYDNKYELQKKVYDVCIEQIGKIAFEVDPCDFDRE